MVKLVKRCGILAALFWLTFFINNAYTAFVFNFTSVTCKNLQPALYTHVSCHIGCIANKSRDVASTTTLNYAFAMARNAPDLLGEALILVERVNGEPYKIVDLTVNVCEFNRMNFVANILAIFYRVMKRHMNELAVCPIKPNFTYAFEELQLNPADFPSYLPENTYKVQLNFVEHGKLVTYLHFAIDVIYKRNLWTKSKRRKN